MKKRILALSKRVFENVVTSDNIKRGIAYISILDKDNEEQRYHLSNNFLQVRMWDIEEDIFENGELKYEKPSDHVLLQILEFIEQNKHLDNFIVHCSAGISRSGAVVRYLSETLDNVDLEFYNTNNKHIHPNLYIYKRLKLLYANQF